VRQGNWVYLKDISLIRLAICYLLVLCTRQNVCTVKCVMAGGMSWQRTYKLKSVVSSPNDKCGTHHLSMYHIYACYLFKIIQQQMFLIQTPPLYIYTVFGSDLDSSIVSGGLKTQSQDREGGDNGSRTHRTIEDSIESVADT